MESCNTELDGWQIMNSGHKVNARLTGSVAFLARGGLKVNSYPISNTVVTITLQVGIAKIGSLFCYALTEPSEDIKATKAFYGRVEKLIKLCLSNVNAL